MGTDKMKLKAVQNPAIKNSQGPPITRSRQQKRHLPIREARKSCHLPLPAYRSALISASLRHGEIDIKFLGKNEEAEEEDYPKYFGSPAKLNIKKMTLSQLEEKYGKSNSASIASPRAK
jgi:hypothetical protein